MTRLERQEDNDSSGGRRTWFAVSAERRKMGDARLTVASVAESN